MQIQIWIPGLDAAWFADGLEQAHLQVLALSEPEAVSAHLPLLIVYCDPLGRLGTQGSKMTAEPDAAILVALTKLERSAFRCRLVNLSCVALPALVAWCVDSGSALLGEHPSSFAVPDPFEALLAMAWLQEHPGQLQAYQTL
ncbi:MAG: hypothetical protein ACKO25_03840, partial [Cyanobium sp.]